MSIDPTLPTLAAAGGFGAIVGSFLNVVIHRVPARIAHQAGIERGEIRADAPMPDGIVFPGSRCPQCGEAIRGYDNIPVLSWLILRGRARCCGASISAQYPFVEMAMAVLAVIVAALFGPTAYGVAFGGVTALLLAMSVIDARTQYLPDCLTLPGVWLGLLVAALLPDTSVTAASAIIGAACGYGVLWTINAGYRLIRGVDGLGGGDFKLFALIGAWGGVGALNATLILAPLTALLIVLIRTPREGLHGQTAIPFGPYLAIAGWASVVITTTRPDGIVQAIRNIGILGF